MSNRVLPDFISRSLHTPVRRYRRTELFSSPCSSIPVPETFCTISGFSDEPYGSAVLSRIIAGRPFHITDKMPVILSVEGMFAYSVIIQKKYVWMIGPLRFREPVYFSHILSDSDLCLQKKADMDSFLPSVPAVNFRDFILQTLLVFNLKKNGLPSSPFLEENEFLAENCVDKTVIKKHGEKALEKMLDNLEIGILHNPYGQEIRERNSIRNGDTDSLRLALKETFSGSYGQLSDDPLRQEIDMGIVTMTLATRAAIEGGLHYEEIFSFCDMTIRQMEAARDPTTVRHIYRNAEYHLTELVRDFKARRTEAHAGRENLHISRCKDYIYGHLHEKITVAQISSAIGLDPSYLSSLFSTHEHITLKQFILNEKIQLAKNMLTYSSYPYIRIATYLGFCSQSHLGQEFKKATGMSLKEFRDAHALEAFDERSSRNQAF